MRPPRAGSRTTTEFAVRPADKTRSGKEAAPRQFATAKPPAARVCRESQTYMFPFAGSADRLPRRPGRSRRGAATPAGTARKPVPA